ncbi:MAG: PAS domain-containing protein, partial [Arcobacteraceae bacterium]
MNDLTQQNKDLLKQTTVLYISQENDENTINLLKKQIKECFILSSKNIFEEYEKIKNIIDIIIADISTEDSTALEFIQQVRSSKDWKKPILIISDLKNTTLFTQIIKLKVENFILKPFNEGTFLKIIEDIGHKAENNKIILQQQEHLEQFKNVLDKLNLVSETNLKGEITYVNKLFCETTGFTSEELIGNTHKLLRHLDTSSQIYKNMWESLQGGKVWQGKLKNVTKNKEPYYVKLIIVPIKNSNGEVISYMSSGFLISDIEEEKQKLKKFIVNQKLDQMNSRKLTQEEINNKARELVLKAKQDAIEKEEKLVNHLRDMDEELRRLRIRREGDKKQIAFLEKEYKEYIENTDSEKKIFQE